jgi:hypothetical protein
MKNKELEALRYPIGRFQPLSEYPTGLLEDWFEALYRYPDKLSTLVSHLTEGQLDTPYRPSGWTVRQVVHHISDSHHNSYMRFKWALTESSPLIKVYDEKAWAGLFDARTGPIELSLAHLTAIHQKLVFLLRGLDRTELKKKFIHPVGGPTTLEENVGRYVWHGNHHYAHIANLLRSRGW